MNPKLGEAPAHCTKKHSTDSGSSFNGDGKKYRTLVRLVNVRLYWLAIYRRRDPMGLIENAKDAAKLVQQIGNIELYEKLVSCAD